MLRGILWRRLWDINSGEQVAGTAREEGGKEIDGAKTGIN